MSATRNHVDLPLAALTHRNRARFGATLTAISLIFSIFLVKPSPFCLLDEVDAPLDDANIGRFNDMIREMTAFSQFILITHSKTTMAVADTLYGVTMEEPGVSKLVSVRLH